MFLPPPLPVTCCCCHRWCPTTWLPLCHVIALWATPWRLSWMSSQGRSWRCFRALHDGKGSNCCGCPFLVAKALGRHVNEQRRMVPLLPAERGWSVPDQVSPHTVRRPGGRAWAASAHRQACDMLIVSRLWAHLARNCSTCCVSTVRCQSNASCQTDCHCQMHRDQDICQSWTFDSSEGAGRRDWVPVSIQSPVLPRISETLKIT